MLFFLVSRPKKNDIGLPENLKQSARKKLDFYLLKACKTLYHTSLPRHNKQNEKLQTTNKSCFTHK